jgi:hypothetical protein
MGNALLFPMPVRSLKVAFSATTVIRSRLTRCLEILAVAGAFTQR